MREPTGAATEILPRRRPSELTDIEAMKQVAEALEALLADFSPDGGRSEMSVESDKNVRPSTKKEKNIKTRIRRTPQPERRLRTTPAHARLLAGAQLAEYIDLYANGAPPDWRAIILATQNRADELGISSREWQNRCTQIGESRAALCLIVADRNAARETSFAVRSAAAAFTGLACKEAREVAVLDSLIGELTHALLTAEARA